jgi:PilZ domain
MNSPAIYLASRTEEENQLLKKKLQNLCEDFPSLQLVAMHLRQLANSADSNMAAVVLNISDWREEELQVVLALRKAGFKGSILVIAKAVAINMLRVNPILEGVVFLERPYEHKDLLGILHKMLIEREVAQRVFRRFYTNETAEIVRYGEASKYIGRVFNMSRGGAHLEFAKAAPLRHGDVVSVKVELKKMNRTYVLPARVVWTKMHDSHQSVVAAGVEFIGLGNVKKSIVGLV